MASLNSARGGENSPTLLSKKSSRYFLENENSNIDFNDIS